MPKKSKIRKGYVFVQGSVKAILYHSQSIPPNIYYFDGKRQLTEKPLPTAYDVIAREIGKVDAEFTKLTALADKLRETRTMLMGKLAKVSLKRAEKAKNEDTGNR